MFHVIFSRDLTSQSIDILILGFLQKFCIRSVIFNGEVSIAHEPRRPDGIVQQVLFYKAMEFAITNPHEKSKHIPRVFFAKETKVFFFALGPAPVRDPAPF